MAKIKQKFIKKSLIMLDKILPVFLLVVIITLSMPHLSLASGLVDVPATPQLPYIAGKIEYLKAYSYHIPRLPGTAEKREARYTYKIWMTAYNSLPGQTDSTPCITASGMDVCERDREDIIATNFLRLPFGTKVRFPELYGSKIFTVQDRMNSRYWKNADIWLKDYAEAKSFGRKWTTIEIF